MLKRHTQTETETHTHTHTHIPQDAQLLDRVDRVKGERYAEVVRKSLAESHAHTHTHTHTHRVRESHRESE